MMRTLEFARRRPLPAAMRDYGDGRGRDLLMPRGGPLTGFMSSRDALLAVTSRRRRVRWEAPLLLA